MRLSLVISDNLIADSTGEALKMYGKASLSFEQNQLEKTMLILDTMERIFLVHNIMDEVLYLKYEVYFKQQEYQKGAVVLTKIVSEFPSDVLADEALFHLAILYDQYIVDTEKAQGLYKQLITEYPASIRVVEARKRYRTMRGDQLN